MLANGKLRLSRRFPKQKYVRQAYVLLQPYMQCLTSDEAQRIENRVDSNFFEFVLDSLKNDTILQRLVEQQGDLNDTRQFLMVYVFEHFDRFIERNLCMTLLQSSRELSRATPIGQQHINFYNYCIYTFYDQKSNQLMLDVGVSYFLCQFWTKVFEHLAFVQRCYKAGTQTSTLDCNALQVSLNQADVSQRTHAATQTDGSCSEAAVHRDYECIIQQLQNEDNQSRQKIQLLQRQLEFLLSENKRLKQCAAGKGSERLAEQPSDDHKSETPVTLQTQLDFDILRGDIAETPTVG